MEGWDATDRFSHGIEMNKVPNRGMKHKEDGDTRRKGCLIEGKVQWPPSKKGEIGQKI